MAENNFNQTERTNQRTNHKANTRALPAICDILEASGKIILKMEMPGVTKENLDVKIDGELLVIHGKKAALHESAGSYLVHEIRDADYYQEYTLDQTIDRGKIDASLAKGVLTLTMYIKESEQPKKINITAS